MSVFPDLPKGLKRVIHWRSFNVQQPVSLLDVDGWKRYWKTVKELEKKYPPEIRIEEE